MKKFITSLSLIIVAVLFMGADDSCGSSASRDQARATEKLALEANAQVGMPQITNFTEKRLLSRLYTLRDQDGLATFTYIVDLQGKLHHLCNSIGYGMPFSAQYTTPEIWATQGATLPVPEPNGLFPPTSTSATWVICADATGDTRPVYVEPEIVVSPFELNAIESYMKSMVKPELE